LLLNDQDNLSQAMCSALTLVFVLGSASAKNASDSTWVPFFYQHIAKTGGTSWSTDLAALGLLRHCGTSHLVGSGSLDTLNRSLQERLASSEQDSQTRCNLFNREDSLQLSLSVFASHGVTPKLILMLRSPVMHVRSMYSHCLGPTGFLRRQKEKTGNFRPLSLVDWLRLFTNTSSAWEQGAYRYCYYNPVNFQTHLLAAPTGRTNDDFVFPKGRFFVPAQAVDRVHSLVHTAFFVGVTEYYAHSVCLVRWLVTGQLPASDCGETARIEMSHNDYGNAADKTVLSGEELSLITQVSRIDELVYGFGLDRMYQDARKANFQLFRRA